MKNIQIKLILLFFIILYQLLWIPVYVILLYTQRPRRFDKKSHKRFKQIFFPLHLLDLRYEKSEGQSFRSKRILLHAVSLGEAKSAIQIVTRFNGGDLFIITTSTIAGYDYLLSQKLACCQVYYMPVDSPLVQFLFLLKFKVSTLIIVEHDIWPGVLMCAKFLSIKTILVSGNFSESTLTAYKRIKLVSSSILNLLDRIELQTVEYVAALMDVGVKSTKLKVSGSLKFLNFSQVDPSLIVRDRWDICFGSVHATEFDRLAQLTVKILNYCPEMEILFVPRHPDRSNDLLRSLSVVGIKCELTYSLDSALDSTSRIIINSELGTLIKAFSTSKSSIVCGSFVAGIGGHNLLEPMSVGSVPIYGSHIYAQRDLHQFIQECGLNCIVYSDEEALAILKTIMDSPTDRPALIKAFNANLLLKHQKLNSYIDNLRVFCYE